MMCMKAIQFYIVCLLPVLAGCADVALRTGGNSADGDRRNRCAGCGADDGAHPCRCRRQWLRPQHFRYCRPHPYHPYSRRKFVCSGRLYAFLRREVGPFGSGLGIAF